MFSLHETTQRRICRVLFVVCCVVPSVLTVGWIAHFYRPWKLSDWQRTLVEQLHVRATVSDISSPQPGIDILSHVELADLSSERPLGLLEEVRVEWENSQLEIHASRLVIETRQLPRLAKAVTTWLSASEFVPVKIFADEVHFLSNAYASHSGRDFQLESSREAVQFKRLEFQFSTADGRAPVQLSIEYQPDANGPHTYATLNTQQATLPAWLLADLVPGGMHRSHGATFTGTGQFDWDTRKLNGTLQGRFDSIDLAQWLGKSTLHRIAGIAALDIVNLVWQDRRIQRIEGTLQCDGGVINPPLLATTSKLMKCTKTPALEQLLVNRTEESVAFDQLAFTFQLDGNGLSVVGKSAAGSLLSLEDEPLLHQPPERMPVTHLVNLLHLPSTSWLPDTIQAHEMAGGLPLPSKTR